MTIGALTGSRASNNCSSIFCARRRGGSVVYTGRDMRTVHIGMRLDEEDWKRGGEYLAATLEDFGVPEQEKDEMLGLAESLKSEIVEVP